MDDLEPLLDVADPAGSEQRLRAAREATTDVTEREWLATQLARSLGLQGRFDDGHAELDVLTGHDPEVAVRIALERGRLFRSAGDPGGAEPQFAIAEERAATARLDGLRLDALHMLALLPEDVEERRRRHEIALRQARSSSDPTVRRWIAPLLHNLGMVQQEAGDLEAALASFEAAVDARMEQGGGEPLRIARWMVAWTKRLLGRIDEALAEQHQLERDDAAAGAPDPHVHDELAELYALIGDQRAATTHRDAAGRLRG